MHKFFKEFAIMVVVSMIGVFFLKYLGYTLHLPTLIMVVLVVGAGDIVSHIIENKE